MCNRADVRVPNQTLSTAREQRTQGAFIELSDAVLLPSVIQRCGYHCYPIVRMRKPRPEEMNGLPKVAEVMSGGAKSHSFLSDFHEQVLFWGPGQW